MKTGPTVLLTSNLWPPYGYKTLLLLLVGKKNWRDQIKILPVGNCFPILDPQQEIYLVKRNATKL